MRSLLATFLLVTIATNISASSRACFAPSATLLPSSALPPPPSNVVLKYVALGIGSQNYTCKASGAPASNGALATLYDARPVLTNQTKTILPPLALSVGSVLTQLPGDLDVMGHHYFNGTLTPIFDLSRACAGPAKLVAKKSASAPAPSDACKGKEGEGAVDWLYLTDAGGSTGGITMVYRVETAGGKAPTTCEGQGVDIVVRYSAEYWFYGPS